MGPIDNTRYGRLVAASLAALVCASTLFAAPCPVCSKWEGQGFHDAQVTKGGRCKTGNIPKGCVASMNKSSDYCIRCQVDVPYNTPSGYRRCPKCYGKGELPDKEEKPVEEPKPEQSADTHPAQEENGNKPASEQKVARVGVNTCDKCDQQGKIVPSIQCDLCENGFNHKKDGASFKCRVCGKACSARFDPCCKPDCPECGAKRGAKIDCPLCGGDKVITPLEEARNNKCKAP